MKKPRLTPLKKQQGAVTLFTAVILLIAITLVTFLTAKTVLEATKMTANNYRTQQAVVAAGAAMDNAIAYFNDAGGLDHNGDGAVDFVYPGVNVNPTDSNCAIPAGTTANAFTLTSGTQTTIAQFYFDNNDNDNIPANNDNNTDGIPDLCTNAGTLSSALIVASGWSDDCTATRTIMQCVGTPNLLKGGGPKQTLVSGSTVGLTGSAQIINRYTDLNVWSAGSTAIGNSSAMETYIRPTNLAISDLTQQQLVSTNPSSNAQEVSSNGLGGGTDIYGQDQRLQDAIANTNNDIAAGGTGDGPGTFFNLFFLETKAYMEGIAADNNQSLASGASDGQLDGLSGIIWVNGNASMSSTGTTVGTPTSPALLIVDGDFSFSGGTINGLLYVTGTTTITGNPNVIGTVISEGSVGGNGTLTLVYSPNVGSGSGIGLKGTGGIISGSWRDW